MHEHFSLPVTRVLSLDQTTDEAFSSFLFSRLLLSQPLTKRIVSLTPPEFCRTGRFPALVVERAGRHPEP